MDIVKKYQLATLQFCNIAICTMPVVGADQGVCPGERMSVTSFFVCLKCAWKAQLPRGCRVIILFGNFDMAGDGFLPFYFLLIHKIIFYFFILLMV